VRFKLYIALIIGFLLSGTKANATHIVGGEMYYELLNASSNLYRITLKLYIDCENGNDQAIASDFTALIGVYDGNNNNYLEQFSITRTGPIEVDKVNYNCVIPPRGVCVDEYTYRETRVINPGPNGKILAFQRCCRNNTINNLYFPESTGITIWTRIPPSSVRNNSAIFKELPPNYVCVDAPLVVDHSATDADGDELVYTLSTPFSGGTTDEPRPNPSVLTRPPFNTVNWKIPYNVSNQMGGDPQMSIDSKTGELTVTPNTKGQFVIGITVQELRNGVVISETRRDYQFNVVECEFDILANFTTQGASAASDAYVFECADTVQFLDKSQKAATYHWDFGDPTTDADTSNLPNPQYVYPGNGDYEVTLLVKNSACQDDYTFNVRIRSKQTFDLGPDVILCDTINYPLNTQTPDATSILWNTGQRSPVIIAQDTGTYIATVRYDRCVFSDTIHIGAAPIEFSIPEDSLFCYDVPIDMVIDAGVPNLNYEWNTGETSQSIRATDPGLYWVTVRNLYCSKRDTTRIWVSEEVDIPDAFYCNEFNHPVNAGVIEEGRFRWSNGTSSQSTIYTSGGKHWLRVSQRHCTTTDSFVITNPVINLELGEDQHFCDELLATLDAGPDGIDYTWSNGSKDREITVTTPATYKVTVLDENGCTKEDSVTLSLTNSPIIDIGDDTTICLSSPTEFAAPEGFVSYLWNTGSTQRVISTFEEGGFKVTVTDEFGCIGSDSLYVTVDENALPNELFVPNAFTPNGDQLNDLFPYKERINQPAYFINIYNRWGEKVFDSREGEQNWDGFYKGTKVPTETFIYFVSYRGCDGNRRTRKGTVNVLY
jgi:gliding motility-associated-like protein